MKKIMIIDDNPHFISYMKRLLNDTGHEVLTESTGMSAINQLANYTPDIIFLDFFLPDINADKLCQIIRNMENLKNICIVVMSAAAKELQLDASKIGANALIAKGIFKETAEHVFSAIADLEKPFNNDEVRTIIGIDSVYPRQITKELLEKYCHIETILDSIAQGIVEIYQGQIVYANPAAATNLGKPLYQLLTVNLSSLFVETEKSKVESIIKSKNYESTTINWKGPLHLENKILSIKKLPLKNDDDTTILLISDITESTRAEEAIQSYQNHLESLVEERTSDLKKAHERLQHIQKMEAIGIIAGGVAHDLNNILTAIVGYPDLLLLELPADSSYRRILLTIKESGKKAADVVQDLLTMARRGVNTNEVVDLNSIIFDFLNSPECEKLKSFHSTTYLETILENNLLNISGSPTHLSKTIMNLIFNAAEAMPDGGKIIVSTENRYVDKGIRVSCGNKEIEEGDYVILTVSDTGVGISAEDIDKIFDPFYTNKIMGRSGTGLGMTVVWGTMEDHKGYINVASSSGKGTTFSLYFPATRQELTKKSSRIPIGEYKGKGESILVVDDVEKQRQMVSMILTMLGYSVSTTSCGEEAVEYIRKNQADLIILDMVMAPGIDGLETFKRIHEFHPDQKAIIASGYSEGELISKCLELGVGQYIKKPYTIENIGIAVRQELDKN
ncbi:MAG: response regulator [Proteobacteria bacterium]|nr:response regulator [Pseudomonadota bacterium]